MARKLRVLDPANFKSRDGLRGNGSRDVFSINAVRYIHTNPVRTNLVRTTNAYQGSSHHSYSGECDTPWLILDQVLAQFGIFSPVTNEALNANGRQREIAESRSATIVKSLSCPGK